jgi:hypothetical protein
VIDVFVSRPTRTAQDFTIGLQGFLTYLESHGFRPRTFGTTDYPLASPLDEVIRLMKRCRGAIILGYPQIEIRSGAVKGREIDALTFLPTEWNQIEAGLAYASGLPLLLIHHLGITGGVFDRGAVNRFIYEVDLVAPNWALRQEVSGAVERWKEEVLQADDSADRRVLRASDLPRSQTFCDSDIPEDVRSAVSILAPEFRVPSNDDLSGNWAQSYCHETGFPIFCTGTFTGRAHGECAIFLLGRQVVRHKVVVFTENQQGSPVLIDLEVGEGYPHDRYLRTLSPGAHQVSRIVWKHGGPRTLHLKRDAIELGTFESANCAYYWDEETESFIEQWLSD